MNPSLEESSIHLSNRTMDTFATLSSSSSSSVLNFVSLACDSNGIKIVGCANVGGIYTSPDSGITWKKTTAPSTEWKSIACSSNGINLFACYPEGIYASVDSGITWNKTTAPKDNYYSVACSSDGKKIVACSPFTSAGDGGSIYTSSDLGKTWNKTNAPLYNFYVCVASSSDGKNLVASTNEGGIYTSPDSGKTWKKTTAPDIGWKQVVSSYDGTKLVACIQGGGGIYTSSDSGQTWIQNKNLPSILDLTSITSISINSGGSQLAVSFFNEGIYTSSDFGNTWENNASIQGWQSIIYPVYGSKIFACATNGIFSVFNDSEKSWHSQSINTLLETNPIPESNTSIVTTAPANNNWVAYSNFETTSLDFSSIACDLSGNKLVACVRAKDYGVGGGIYTSTDSGKTWSNDNNAPNANWKQVVSSYDGIKLVACIIGGGIYASVDSGKTWIKSNAINDEWQNVASSSDGTKLVACILRGGIYTSTDSGITWNKTSALIESWSNVACNADGSKLFACVLGGGIYTSADSGITWSNDNNAPTADWNSVVCNADGSKLVGCVIGGGIYTSLDSGKTWNNNNNLSNIIKILNEYNKFGGTVFSQNGNLILAYNIDIPGGGSYIFISRDSGKTWEKTNAPYTKWYSIATNYDGSKIFACSGITNPGPYIYTSTDLGRTWNPIVNRFNVTNRLKFSGIACSSDGSKMVACVGEGGIYTSSDSGKTWNLTTPPKLDLNWTSVACSADGNKIIVCSDGNYKDGEMYTSSDFGKTWNLLNPPKLDITSTIKNTYERITQQWHSVACSTDGNKIVACRFLNVSDHDLLLGAIYTSLDFGKTWNVVKLNDTTNHLSTTCSADGNIMVVTSMFDRVIYAIPDSIKNVYSSKRVTTTNKILVAGGIYTSYDSGKTWTNDNNAPFTKDWNHVACSADGTKMVAVCDGADSYISVGTIYTSGDSGKTWIKTNAPLEGWYHVACSADGNKLFACTGGVDTGSNINIIGISNDFGLTWSIQTFDDIQGKFSGITCNSDGSIVAVCTGRGQILILNNSNSNSSMKAMNDVNENEVTVNDMTENEMTENEMTVNEMTVNAMTGNEMKETVSNKELLQELLQVLQVLLELLKKL